jgi:hypothetical protein
MIGPDNCHFAPVNFERKTLLVARSSHFDPRRKPSMQE